MPVQAHGAAAAFSRTIPSVATGAFFNLRHTFSQHNVVYLPEGSTQNLMDYSTGTELLKYQWDFIHNPEGGWFVFEDWEEGAMVSIPDLLSQIRKANIDGKRIVEITQDECPENAYINVPIGGRKLDYFAIHCTDDFETIPTEPQTTTFTGWNQSGGNNKIQLIPSQRNTVEYESTRGWLKMYQFFEAEELIPPLDYQNSDNLLFEFVIFRKDAAIFESYLYGDFYSDTIKIFITRTHTGENSTTGTLVTDDGTISGYTVELPRGTDNECKTVCTDNKKPFDCHCIIEGTYNFVLNEISKYPGESLRLEPNGMIPDGRSGVLIHQGRDDAKGWSQGCILPMPNKPEINSKLSSKNRNNTEVNSQEFVMQLRNWVSQRENLILKNNPNIQNIVKQIIITKTF